MKFTRAFLSGVLAVGVVLTSGCASVSTQGSGGLTRVFVPPPPLGGSSSTITVIPAKRGGTKPAEKSWGPSETPGGSAANTAHQEQTVASISGDQQTVTSLYEISGARGGEGVQGTVKHSGAKPIPQEKPMPVFYERKKDKLPAEPSQQLPPTDADFDPRLAS